MKVVINDTYGGFEIPYELKGKVNLFHHPELGCRTDPALVNWVLVHREESELEVVELPDNATDWYIEEYDGLEQLMYVLDGKIHWAEEVEDEHDESEDIDDDCGYDPYMGCYTDDC